MLYLYSPHYARICVRTRTRTHHPFTPSLTPTLLSTLEFFIYR